MFCTLAQTNFDFEPQNLISHFKRGSRRVSTRGCKEKWKLFLILGIGFGSLKASLWHRIFLPPHEIAMHFLHILSDLIQLGKKERFLIRIKTDIYIVEPAKPLILHPKLTKYKFFHLHAFHHTCEHSSSSRAPLMEWRLPWAGSLLLTAPDQPYHTILP